MPLFGSKFSPKKKPVRRSCSALQTNVEPLEELVGKDGKVRLKLGESSTVFSQGEWMPGESGNVHKSNNKLRNKLRELEEENNMLKLKYEILLNMLTQATAESHLQQRELEKFHKTTKSIT